MECTSEGNGEQNPFEQYKSKSGVDSLTRSDVAMSASMTNAAIRSAAWDVDSESDPYGEENGPVYKLFGDKAGVAGAIWSKKSTYVLGQDTPCSLVISNQNQK
jgi:hypothetical protein